MDTQLDPVKVDRAESEIDKFIASRANARKQANEEAAAWARADRGANYKCLAAIAHAWGMTRAERIGWYRVVEELPLSDRHAGHILARLKKRAA